MTRSDAPALGGDTAAAAYEQLHVRALAGSTPGSAFGLLLLLREGVAAWLARGRPDRAPVEPPADPGRRTTAPVVFDEIHAGLVRVLASMALAGRQETSP